MVAWFNNQLKTWIFQIAATIDKFLGVWIDLIKQLQHTYRI